MIQFIFALIPLFAAGQAETAEAPAPTPAVAATPAPEAATAEQPAAATPAAADEEAGVLPVVDPEDVAVGTEEVPATTSKPLIRFFYLIAAILFVFGIKGLTHPKTAVRGNLISAGGMVLAVAFTLMASGLNFYVILAGLIVGGAIGAYAATKVEMTAMPEMVALFNGFGGIASALVAGAALITEAAGTTSAVATAASGIIGSVTFTGSLVAFGKLYGLKWVPDGQIIPQQKIVSVVLLVVCILLGWWLVATVGAGASPHIAYWLIFILAGVLGILLTIPIGGADMPVVIALLNSYSGLAASATGFVIGNNVLITAGALVGASGLILTSIMCKAMNRSLANVAFGKLGPTGDTPSADEVYKTVKAASPEEVAILFESAQKAVIVPGYGMAVSQCQHAVRDLMNLCESRGCHVDFAVHPVAGRMPGHMNVLLAEANVPYEKLREMDEINAEMQQYDVGLVIGANDVVNPVARTDPNSPIAGMPIIDVDKCRTCVVVKRSLSPGFAGIPNPLFAAENTLMMFGDGKKAMLELIAALKET